MVCILSEILLHLPLDSAWFGAVLVSPCLCYPSNGSNQSQPPSSQHWGMSESTGACSGKQACRADLCQPRVCCSKPQLLAFAVQGKQLCTGGPEHSGCSPACSTWLLPRRLQELCKSLLQMQQQWLRFCLQTAAFFVQMGRSSSCL